MIDVPHNLSSGEYSVGDASGTVLEMAQNRLAIAFATEAAAEYGMSRRPSIRPERSTRPPPSAG